MNNKFTRSSVYTLLALTFLNVSKKNVAKLVNVELRQGVRMYFMFALLIIVVRLLMIKLCCGSENSWPVFVEKLNAKYLQFVSIRWNDCRKRFILCVICVIQIPIYIC